MSCRKRLFRMLSKTNSLGEVALKSLKSYLTLFIALSLVVGGAQVVALAASTTQLEAQATNDLIVELRLAAGLALADIYAQTKSMDQLETLAGDASRSPYVRLGAATALSQMYVSGVTEGTVTLDHLLDVATNGATAELRGAAKTALVDRLVGNFAAADLAVGLDEATNAELADAYATALIVRLAVSLTSGSPASILARTETVAGGGTITVAGVTLDGSDEAVQLAMAREYLSGFYVQFGHLVFDDLIGELTDRAENGATAGIREAASIALETLSLSGQSASAVEGVAADGASAELRAAAGRVLARKLSVNPDREALIFKITANTLVHPAVAEAAAAALAKVL